MYETYTESGHPQTPMMTVHARERCAQMQISTRVIKRLWRQRGVVRPLHGQERVMVTSPEVPDYTAVMDLRGERPVVVTVLFNEAEEYVRDDEGGYRIVEES